MAAEPLPHELTDEALAKIAWRAYDDGHVGPWEWDADRWIAAARAVRAALVPDVTPLAPGETVTIPECRWLPGQGWYGVAVTHDEYDGRSLAVEVDDGEVGVRAWLDAAGVAALREACDRWFAAQNETQVVKTG